MQNNLLILVLSKNLAKVKAVEDIFSSVFKDKHIIVESLDCDSGVSETPTNDEEAILGIKNRLENYKNSDLSNNKYDYVISMEGLINSYSFGCFVYGWVMIEDINRRNSSYGCSAKVKIPNKIANEINPNSSLSDIVKEKYTNFSQETIDSIGTNGVITNELFTRVDEFKTALLTSLGYLLNRQNHES
ncbi:inosine/xanthosine triphosphatase [Vibrio caribbeanicus]|uniref:inosine/xanthosine triphosphatase n=1 Tax=Vibrio caribbeanicus TaxID=701175 RepID=UPI002284869A|nr:inosine/xanthosine triphosphatase [Vibrio caribbeanicus]MCY9845811.1 inosine/xanthosine triphosphatase [Vibrio caribbeanicus]